MLRACNRALGDFDFSIICFKMLATELSFDWNINLCAISLIVPFSDERYLVSSIGLSSFKFGILRRGLIFGIILYIRPNASPLRKYGRNSSFPCFGSHSGCSIIYRYISANQRAPSGPVRVNTGRHHLSAEAKKSLSPSLARSPSKVTLFSFIIER